MSNGKCPTVKIVDDKAPNGFVVINESDFDCKVHALHESETEVEGVAEVVNEVVEGAGDVVVEPDNQGWGAAPPPTA